MFYVSQEHIDAGKRQASQLCPVALSLKGRGFRPAVGTSFVIPNIPALPEWFTGPALQKFIKDFDAGIEVSPIFLELKDTTLDIVHLPEHLRGYGDGKRFYINEKYLGRTPECYVTEPLDDPYYLGYIEGFRAAEKSYLEASRAN